MNHTEDGVFLRRRRRLRKSSIILSCILIVTSIFCSCFFIVKTYALPQTESLLEESALQKNNGSTDSAESDNAQIEKEPADEDAEAESTPPKDDSVDKPNESVHDEVQVIGETVLLKPLNITMLKVDASNIEYYLGWQYGYYVVGIHSASLPKTLLYARFLEAGPCKTLESAMLYMKEMNSGEKLSFTFETEADIITYTFVKE